MLRPFPVLKTLISRLSGTERQVKVEPAQKKLDETVLCAALWINDYRCYSDQPVNIESGFVVAGRSHAQCFSAIEAALSEQTENGSGLNKARIPMVSKWELPVSGFITSKNRFLDRKSAFELAFNSGQLEQRGAISTDGMLRSTDLF